MIYDDEAQITELLAPLRRLEPVPFTVSERRRRRASRPVIAAAVVAGVLALAGVAVAGVLGAFDGIAAAQHPQTGADVIDPATRAYMECQGVTWPCMAPPPRGVLWDTTRVVGRLPTGQNIYVFTTRSSELCYLVGPPRPEWDCEDPLTRSHPSTVFEYSEEGAPYTLVGIALDGVSSVSFDERGREVTVPVKDNVWIYRTDYAEAFYDAGSALRAHLADGTTVVQTYP
ncbi:MAG TPA: hypothetical protein VE984_00475 [Gaiellaceae bacterium]|nr:hypothetical protein [Gaiellaceae bacterium]